MRVIVRLTSTDSPPLRPAPFARSARLAPLSVNKRLEFIAEVKKLRDGIRLHRDSTRHELCWHHPLLWGLLPEKTDPIPVVPGWPEFIRGCVRYRQSLDEQAPDAPPTDEPFKK